MLVEKKSETGFEEQAEPVQEPTIKSGKASAKAPRAIWPDQANNFGEEVEPMENDEGSTALANNKIEDQSKGSDLYNNEQDAAWEKRFQRLKSQHVNTEGDSQQDKSIDNSRSNGRSKQSNRGSKTQEAESILWPSQLPVKEKETWDDKGSQNQQREKVPAAAAESGELQGLKDQFVQFSQQQAQMMQQFTQLSTLVQGLDTRLNAFESNLDAIKQVQTKIQQDMSDQQLSTSAEKQPVNTASFAPSSLSQLQQSQQLLRQSQQAQSSNTNATSKLALLNYLQQDPPQQPGNNDQLLENLLLQSRLRQLQQEQDGSSKQNNELMLLRELAR